MAKYSKKAAEKVEKTMHEMHEGKLKTGTGKKVTSRKQAVAIGLSEAREAGAKVPKKSSGKSAKRKPATKKAVKSSGKSTPQKTASKSGNRRSASSKKAK